MAETTSGIGGKVKGPDVKKKLEDLKGKAHGSGKNIVLCSDGTGNRGGKGRGTNVWAIFNAVWRQPDAVDREPPKRQIAFHDDGVGTQSFVLFKILGGAFGWGHSRNIRELYKSLVLSYNPGDSIYLFGFSRGAYTVRGLAGMILNCGILNRGEFKSSNALDGAVRAVFRANRDRYWANLGRARRWLRPGSTKAYEKYKNAGWIHDLKRQDPEAEASIETHIRFIGVWDTVDAVGLPIDWLANGLDLIARYRFRDHELHSNVDKACHAVSLDDQRRTFWPVMWSEKLWRNGKEITEDRIEQVWFPGVHSNVGGGYPKDQVATVALDWMMENAEREGLHFYDDVRDRVREAANAHGQHYDSRAGLASYYRYHPRKLENICDSRRPKVKIETPKIHVSAFRRIARATANYAPANLPEDIQLVATRENEQSLAHEVQSIFENRKTSDQRKSVMGKVDRYVGFRRVLYWLFLAYSVAIVGLAGWFRWGAGAPRVDTAVQLPKASEYVINVINFVIPDALVDYLGPMLRYAGVHWQQVLVPVAVLLLFVILKFVFERKSRHMALDAWSDFRKVVHDEKILSAEQAGPN